MAKEYSDHAGCVWERFDNKYTKHPTYAIPDNIPFRIQSLMLSQVDAGYRDYTFKYCI